MTHLSCAFICQEMGPKMRLLDLRTSTSTQRNKGSIGRQDTSLVLSIR
jgi:hypothetical protein